MADLVLDNHAPLGDAAVQVGDDLKVGGVSNVMTLVIIQTIVVATVKMLVERGLEPPVFKSGNVDGSDEWNAAQIPPPRPARPQTVAILNRAGRGPARGPGQWASSGPVVRPSGGRGASEPGQPSDRPGQGRIVVVAVASCDQPVLERGGQGRHRQHGSDLAG